MDNIIEFIILSLFLSFALNYLFHLLFLKYNKIDAINERSSHNSIATKSGGVSIFTGLFIITLVLYYFNLELYDFSLLLPLGLMFVTGVYDDFYNADFKLKFFIQLIVAKLFIDQGFFINNLHGLLGIYEIPYIISQIITALVFLAIVNSINFTDGIDGLASSLIVFYLIIFEAFMGFSSSLFYLNLVTVFLIFPFYFFNVKKKNKVFLGDAGSLFLGSLVYLNMLLYLDKTNNHHSLNPVLISFTILIYPLLDLIRVFFLRIKNGVSPFKADKNHLHHKLVYMSENHYLRVMLILTSSILILFLILTIENTLNTIYSVISILIISILTLKIK